MEMSPKCRQDSQIRICNGMQHIVVAKLTIICERKTKSKFLRGFLKMHLKQTEAEGAVIINIQDLFQTKATYYIFQQTLFTD